MDLSAALRRRQLQCEGKSAASQVSSSSAATHRHAIAKNAIWARRLRSATTQPSCERTSSAFQRSTLHWPLCARAEGASVSGALSFEARQYLQRSQSLARSQVAAIMSGTDTSAQLLTDGGDVSGAQLQAGQQSTSLLYGDDPNTDVDTMFVLLSGYLVRNYNSPLFSAVSVSCLIAHAHSVDPASCAWQI